MKVSIITVCLNAANHLQDCLDSIRTQTHNDIELIVVDGKSSDRTVEVILSNRDIISHFISEKDNGMYDAINKGIALATGDIVGVLNSDDAYASCFVLEKIVAGFHHNSIDAVYGNLVYIDPKKKNEICRIWKGKVYNRKLFKFGWMPAHPTFYIKRCLIQRHGLYKNHYHTAADYEFMARYLYQLKYSAIFLDEILVKMRVGGLSNNSIKGRLRANRRDYLAMKENGIPFPLLVSILKPLTKLHQFKSFPAEMKISGNFKLTALRAERVKVLEDTSQMV